MVAGRGGGVPAATKDVDLSICAGQITLPSGITARRGTQAYSIADASEAGVFVVLLPVGFVADFQAVDDASVFVQN